MIPSLEALSLWCRFLARRYDWELSPLDARLLESMQASRDAAISLDAPPQDEPAALFFAFSQDSAFLGEDVLALPMTLARNTARAQGLELRASRFELIDLARSIAGRVASYDDVRRWFAERLAPRR